MAVHKAKRSNSLAQPGTQHRGPKGQRRRINRPQPGPQSKANLFEILHHLNRGFGIVLAKIGVLENHQNGRLFPPACLRNLRNRTEELRAMANHELLRIVAGREEQDAARFGRLRAS